MTEPFRDLVHRYQDLVCGVAYAVLRDRARSEEVAQDAFLVAWQKLPALSPPPAMPGWLCAITRNLARNAARKRRETPMTSSEDGREPAASATPLEELLDAETEHLANRALAELPDGYREVVVLHYRGERSVAEIAGALGISEANAKQRLHRGRARLRSTLAAVEKTLRATRPGPAFTAACVAALAAGGASAEAAAVATKSSGWGTATVVAVPVAAAIVLGAGGFAVMRYGGGAGERAPGVEQVSDVASAGSAAAQAGSAKPGSAAKGARDSVAIRRLDPQQRALLGERIEEARRRREATSAPPTSSGGAGGAPPSLPGTLSKEEIRGAVRAVVPLLAECYDEALPRLGNIGGKLVVKMKLTGEPDVGTVVDAHSVEGDPPLMADTELTRCWRETMNAIELPPLVVGGEVEVNYPFIVRPGPEDGSAAR